MISSRKHPHTDMPSEDELARLILGKHPGHRELYLEMHRLVLDVVSDLRYSVDCLDAAIGYGARQFGYNGWGMAALAPHKSWVSLVFFRGTRLDDPDGLLEGTGALVRHVKLASLEELASRRESLTLLLRAAVSNVRE